MQHQVHKSPFQKQPKELPAKIGSLLRTVQNNLFLFHPFSLTKGSICFPLCSRSHLHYPDRTEDRSQSSTFQNQRYFSEAYDGCFPTPHHIMPSETPAVRGISSVSLCAALGGFVLLDRTWQRKSLYSNTQSSHTKLLRPVNKTKLKGRTIHCSPGHTNKQHAHWVKEGSAYSVTAMTFNVSITLGLSNICLIGNWNFFQALGL